MQRRKFLTRSAQVAIGAAMLPELVRASAVKAAPVVVPVTGAGPARLNVRDTMFGATGDGVTKDTVALQAALDRCGVLGGGYLLNI